MTISAAGIAMINKMNEASRRHGLGTAVGGLETASTALQAGTLGPVRKLSQTVGFAAFTDGLGASGTFTTGMNIPVGATVLFAAVTAVTGFAGNVSAVMTIGDGTVADRYNTSTINVFATAAGGISAGAVSGVAYHAAAKDVVLTVTGSSDFTAINAGSVTVEIYYLT
jgi:hypothetical protein